MRLRDWALLLAPLVVLGAIVGCVIQWSVDGPMETDTRPAVLRDETPVTVPTSGESLDHSFGLVDTPIGKLLSRSHPDSLRTLIGERVQLPVDMRLAANDVAFWVGPSGRALLVVIDRDTRSNAERQKGLPSGSPLGAVSDATQLIVSGVITRVPAAEGRHSWALSREDAALLNQRGAYLRVDSVEPPAR